MKSIWSDSCDNTTIPQFSSLKTDVNTDVLIIGGGMAGVLTAYFLHQKSVKYMLVEADEIGSGITKNTTAKITAQHGLVYNNLIKDIGSEGASKYLFANLWAVEQYKKLCSNIDCNFEIKPSLVYSTVSNATIEDEVMAVDSLGFNTVFTNRIPLPINIKGAIKFPNQAQFNPMKFIKSISKGLNIFEHTFIKSVSGNTAKTSNATITAKKIIITSHFPFINLYGMYPLKLYQHRSYVIALKDIPNIQGMYLEDKKDGLSFRNYEDLLLIGGGDHRTGKVGGGFDVLRDFAKRHYKGAREQYSWATQDCMSLDGIPYIGSYSSITPNLLVATGFNKWGMTSSMVSASILSDMVLDKQNEFSDIFSPSRSIMKKQLLLNAFESTSNLLSFNPKRCSHLGCALHWNKNEHSWDCACHGSRFSNKGNLIDGPAKRDINVK